jgi:predicted small integral membrane protein
MTTTKTVAQKNVTSVKLFVLFVFMFLSTSTVFGQETKETVSIVEPTTELVSSENSIATTTTEFAVWFVGSTNKTSQTKPGTLSFGRKQLINSGITTNKVLIKVVLKKIVGQDSSIA